MKISLLSFEFIGACDAPLSSAGRHDFKGKSVSDRMEGDLMSGNAVGLSSKTHTEASSARLQLLSLSVAWSQVVVVALCSAAGPARPGRRPGPRPPAPLGQEEVLRPPPAPQM